MKQIERYDYLEWMKTDYRMLRRFQPKNMLAGYWREISLALLLLLWLAFGGLPSFANRRPDDLLFFEFFIKDVLLILVIAGIFWFIQLQKSKPQRILEYKFLNSLPISHSRLSLHFLAKDFYHSIWVPGLTVMLIFTLMPYAPISHIFRVNIFVLLLYDALILWNLTVHAVYVSRKYNALSRLHPLIVFAVVFIFLSGTFVFVSLDSLLSGRTFWLLLSSILVMQTLSLIVFHRVFTRWQQGNRVYETLEIEVETHTTSFWYRQQWRMSPFLFNNVLKIKREVSPFVTVLSAVFILCGYLASRNNARINDFLAILNATVILYAIIFACRAQNILANESEATRLLYSLPVRRHVLYISTFVPVFIWMLVISLIFFLLAISSGISAPTCAVFWLKSFSISAGLVLVALNFAFLTKAAQKYFVYWGLLYLIMMALFYNFRHVILFAMVIMSVIPLLKIQLFRV
ncbi:hypothetical protein JW998_17385 [candidate division KSB1 bacterium]|nr:hypothetical protein [candidate division KSB1 bacterium]